MANAPADVTRRLLRRLLETFFRRPIACLLPLVLLIALGAWSVRDTEEVFTSRGVMTVSTTTLLGNLTEVPTGADTTWWETPAEATSRTINELMGTEEFAHLVAERAGMARLVASDTVTLDDIRGMMGTSPSGSSLVAVSASTDDPEMSARLATALLDTFIEWVGEGDLAESEAAQSFFAERVEIYAEELRTARAALDDFLLANAPADGAELAADKQSESDRLESEVSLAQERYNNAIRQREEASLASEQATSDINQRLRVLDVPQIPTSPEQTPTRREAVMTVALFTIAGLLFSAGLVVLGTLLDRSVRSVDDVRNRLGAEVLAVVPAASRR